MVGSDRDFDHGRRFASFIIDETIEGRLARSRLVITIFESSALANQAAMVCQRDKCGAFGETLALIF